MPPSVRVTATEATPSFLGLRGTEAKEFSLENVSKYNFIQEMHMLFSEFTDTAADTLHSCHTVVISVSLQPGKSNKPKYLVFG